MANERGAGRKALPVTKTSVKATIPNDLIPEWDQVPNKTEFVREAIRMKLDQMKLDSEASEEINYYVFDSIEKEKDMPNYWAHKGDEFCEVFPIMEEDTEDELIANGYAKCDAPGTETFVVLESDAELLFS